MSKRTTRAGASFAASLISLFSLSYFNLSRSDDTADTSTTKGPGAALKCASSGKNAYDTFGAAAFVAVNESIFTIVGTNHLRLRVPAGPCRAVPMR